MPLFCYCQNQARFQVLQALLCEATELLTEANSRQVHEKNLGKRQDKVRSDREENRKRLENEPAKREYYGKNAVKSYLDTAKMKIIDNKLAKEEARIMEEAKKISARIDPNNITASLNNKKRKHSDWVIHERDRKALRGRLYGFCL